MKKKINFKWNVLTWDINKDNLEFYDVVPTFISALKSLKKKDRPKTKEALSIFLKAEAHYHFWARCEYEVLVKSWPQTEKDIKIDVFDQLQMNWDVFIDAFWNIYVR